MMRPPALRFAGYAALFGTPDASRDTIAPGAFARTLAERSSPIPLFWQHCPEQRIGWIEQIAEPRDGVRIFDRATGQFLLYAGEWRREPGPVEPVGGSVVDLEARSAIVAILQLLRRTGILPGE